MILFEKLFGINPDQIRPNCILMPFCSPKWLEPFEVTQKASGLLYTVWQTEHFSLIKTGIGATLAGDAALCLKETPCHRAAFLGTCGLIGTDPGRIGEWVLPSKVLAWDSFSTLINGSQTPAAALIFDLAPAEQFLASNKDIPLSRGIHGTFPSLVLEENYLDEFKKHAVLTVDLECSAVLAACRSVGISIFSLLVISDLLVHRPFWQVNAEEQKTTAASVAEALKRLSAHFQTQ